ncbi:MAG: oxalurate catabolism protein HpxZ [Rhodobacteraceae bacterium]|nr:MAG: oxalurate catabolism protein HpxZ [Paracoccaceae bacterium]
MITVDEINIPEVMAEVRAAFDRYEAALLKNDTEILDAMFLPSDDMIRYGVADIQYGPEELRAWRAHQSPFERRLFDTRIVTYGRDVAIAATLFCRSDAPDDIGRQMQTWLHTKDGWRIVAAHVSTVLKQAMEMS